MTKLYLKNLANLENVVIHIGALYQHLNFTQGTDIPVTDRQIHKHTQPITVYLVCACVLRHNKHIGHFNRYSTNNVQSRAL